MHALVFAGGEPVPARWHEAVHALLAHAPDAPLVVAADSGLEGACGLGIPVDLVVGDLDSVDPATLAAARDGGAEVDAHPTDKDATDLELALDAAIARGARAVTVLGAGGGRLDHFLANLLLLGAQRFAAVTIDALVGDERACVVRPGTAARLSGPVGSLVTLLPVGGPALGVRTTGLRWPLRGEHLAPGTTRGVSNEMTAQEATVSLDGGVLLAVQALEADPSEVEMSEVEMPEVET